MSNGETGRMVGTVKPSIGRSGNASGQAWYTVPQMVLFGYRSRPNREGVLPFELLYGVKPKILAADHGVESIRSTKDRDMELLSLCSLRPERANMIPRTENEVPVYQEEDKVLVGYGAVFSGQKWPAFQSKYYVHCAVVCAHLHYKLISATGRCTHKPIHARRLVRFHQRKKPLGLLIGEHS